MIRYNFKSLLLVLATLAALTACKPEEYVLEDAPSKLEGINGAFTLVEVIQVDEMAAAGTTSEVDVSKTFIGSQPASINFNSSNSTYTYTTGSSVDFLGATGSWTFDDNDYPTMINMNNGTTYQLDLLHSIRPQDAFLELRLERMCSGQNAVSYKFKFQRN